jgi:uncharacterized membrane protein HdeD (DUF308 family)
LKANPTQAFNALVSTIVTLAVGVALGVDTHWVFYVLGGWAFLAGLLQLGTGIRRWRGFVAQWPMVLSGAQSAAAGFHFIVQGGAGLVPSPRDIALYAAFGAFYFFVSAVWLTVAQTRRHAVWRAAE